MIKKCKSIGYLFISFLALLYVGLSDAVAADIIIDNLDSANVSFSGAWKESGGQYEWNGSSFYGRDGDTFSFHFIPPETGPYQVREWHSLYSTRSASVLMTIEHDGSATPAERIVDQTVGGQTWNPLGEYNFTAGTTYLVTIVGQPGSASTCADAVMFRPVTSDIIIDNLDSANVSFSGAWEESGGQYEWNNSSFYGRDGDTFSFHFISPETGPYQVLEWHSLYNSRSDSVLMRLVHDGSGAILTEWPAVNQKIGGNTWNLLPGEFNLTAGEKYTVTIVGDPGPSSTCADAVTIRSVSVSGPPLAAFSSTPTSGDIPLTVQFTDQSTGATSWEWDFDNDGAVDSTNQNPSHQYTAAGTYTVKLTATNNVGFDEEIKTNYISVTETQQPPDIVIDNLDSANVSFTGTWTESGGQFEWNGSSYFGRDGDTFSFHFVPTANGSYQVLEWHSLYYSRSDSVLMRLVHDGSGAILTEWPAVNQKIGGNTWNLLPGEFNLTAGEKYTVTIVGDPGPSSTCADAVTIRPVSVSGPPLAAFSSTPTSGNAPLTVQFTDQSTGATSWEWDFDNNGTVDSTVQNPSHQYTAAGTYTVKLTARNSVGFDEEIKVDFITATQPQQTLVAAFSGTPTSGNAPLTVQFNDQSAGATSWAWDFNNDGVVDSTVQNPSYQYPAAGIYTVKLTATNTVDSDEEIKTNYITVNEPQQPPVADFSGTPSNGSAPLTVQFTNQSTGATGWAWDFNNDGVVDSTVQSPSFRYTAAGTYSVKLTATNNAGSDDEIKPGYISVTGSGQTVQHVYALPIFDVYYSYFRKALIEIGATQVNQEDWTYRNTQGQDFIVHVVQNDPERIKEILRCNGCDIVMAGHSNYGSGHAPSSDAENAAGRLYGILYVDDPGIVKMTSPFFDGNTSGIRSHFDPGWQPNYISGESAIMPFGFFDPSGESPPYNYEIPYKIGTNPTCYSTGLERMLPESDAVAWFDPDCGVPDPTEPGDWQYFITADVAYRVGSWTTGAATGDYGSNYYYTGPGGGDKKVIWETKVREAGNYTLYGWWPSSASNTEFAAYTVNQPDGSEIARFENVDQTNGGTWREIGQFNVSNPGPVAVVLTNAAGDSGNVIADAIRIVSVDNPAAVEANFRSSVRFGAAPLRVSFYTQHTGDVAQYEWDFDSNGTIDSTSASPTFTYQNPGRYSVTLRVRDANGNEDSSTFINYIAAGVSPDPVYAEFSNSSPTGNIETAPATVSFTDRSVTSGGTIVSWRWDLDGNGTTDSTAKDPNFTYSIPGIYTVRLTVTDNLGNSATKIKENYVLVIIHDSIVDNSTSPTRHYSDRTILRRNGLPDVPKEQLGYRRLYIHSCQGRYYLEQYPHGTVFYASITFAGPQAQIWLKGVLQGKSDNELWRDLQATIPIFNYIVFPD